MTKNSLKYFFLTLFLTSSLFLLKHSNLKDSTFLRNLFTDKTKSYLCNKAWSRLTDKYNGGLDEERDQDSNLSKAQQSIIDFARDSSYSNIKPYLKRVGIFIAFIVLAIILIFIWISYCSCCCCSCCLFGNGEASRKCQFICYAIAAFCCLLVIIFSIVVLSLINPFLKRINGLGCSVFYLLDHIRYGLSPSYPNNANEWIGIEGIIDRLNYTQEEIDYMSEQLDYFIALNKGVNDTCKAIYNVDNDFKIINELLNYSFDIDFDEQIDDLYYALEDFNEADDDIGEDVYDAMHDYVNKYTKIVFNITFSFTLVLGVLGLSLLSLYFFLKYNVFRIIYVVIWNISMIFMFLAIISSAAFGILGYVLKDAAQVCQYILSPKNLDSNDPLIFSTNDKYVSDLIDICANGNGTFTNIIQESGYLTENIEKYLDNITNYQNIINSINSDNVCNSDDKKKLIDYYNGLIDISYNAINLTNNLTDIKCRFAKNDKNIILNEVESGGNRGVTLSAFSFLIGALLGISILFGILLVHRYKYNDNQQGNVNNKANDTLENLGENYNRTDIQIKNPNEINNNVLNLNK